MRLTCPRCGTAYELDDQLMPATGAAVECTHCSLVWQSRGPQQVSIPGVEVPREFLERLARAPQDPGVWTVLEDWLLERKLVSVLPTSHLFQTSNGLTLHTHRRCGLATHGTLSTLDYHPPPSGAVTAMLEAPELAVLSDLRVRATWPPRPALVAGAAMPPHPRTVIPELVQQVLATSLPRLARLAIWLDRNPGWSTGDDCLSQLEALTRRRPSSATHLELRAPTRGLLKLLRPVARLGWRAITVRAPFSVEELGSLAELVTATPDVDFCLMTIPETPTPVLPARNLRWVDDGERLTVTAERAGARWDVEPDSPWLPNELASLLDALCLELKGDLGLWEFRRGRDATRKDQLTVNGVEVLASIPVRSGERYHVSFQSSQANRPSRSESFVFRQG